jgi:DNA-binding PadR family transcriptional regulator
MAVRDIADRGAWMRGAAAPIRGVLLGLLLERPGAGHELAHRLLERLGATWRLEAKIVYRLLEQLEREGLASARMRPLQPGDRRAHVVFHPTAETAGALGEWMAAPAPREAVRLNIQAKLAVAREQDTARLLAALRGYEQECLHLASRIDVPEVEVFHWPQLTLDCARDGVRGMLRAEIDWAHHAQQRIREHAERSERASLEACGTDRAH